MTKKLERLIVFSHKISVYVPSTKNDENGATHIDNAKYVEDIAKILSDTFGGATASDALGFWVSKERGLEKERTTLVFAFAESLKDIDRVIEWCEDLKVELGQDNVALEIDNQMYLI